MMAAQKLEKIPEETVERVTSDVPKTKPATAKTLAVLLLIKD